MKIQGLAIIAIIIILPMSIILSSYAHNQIKTLDLQVQYDSKLQNATYDAIKAFQLNMSNSTTSDLANSKMRDIEASINTFYSSLLISDLFFHYILNTSLLALTFFLSLFDNLFLFLL